MNHNNMIVWPLVLAGLGSVVFIFISKIDVSDGYHLTANVFAAGDELYETSISTLSEPLDNPPLPLDEPPLVEPVQKFDGSFKPCPWIAEDTEDEPYFLAPLSKDIALYRDYIPFALVSVAPHIPTRYKNEICIESTTAIATRELFEGAKEAGHHLVLTSGYRSYETQRRLFAEKHNPNEEYQAVAIEGHSEHQLGTTIDVGVVLNNGVTMAGRAFGNTEASLWIAEHAHQYGFIVSYPYGKESLTGYIHEPWHLRYIGPENAIYLYENELTLIEALEQVI